MLKKDLKNHTPLYIQLSNIIQNRINDNIYKEGSCIPSELELQHEFSISRTTVRKALKLLTDNKVLIKLPGKGTFVSNNQNEVKTQKNKFLSFTESVKKTGKKLSSRLIVIKKVSGTNKQRNFLKINENDSLIEIKRLRYLDDVPFCVEWLWLPPKFTNISKFNLNKSFYKILQKEYNIIPNNGKKTFRITFATQEESFLINVDQNTPLMEINDYVYDSNNFPLHISKQVLRSDKFTYAMDH